MPVSAVLTYRDDAGTVQEIRVTAADPGELDRIRRAYHDLERTSERQDRAWKAKHANFTDAKVKPGQVTKRPVGTPRASGYPPEGPYFSFALFLGESAVWSGPDANLAWIRGRRVCRFCGHFRRGLPLVAYCLGCDRSGRDSVIPRGRPRTEAVRRPEAAQVGTGGVALKGGMAGKK